MKRYTKREVSKFLGEVRRRNGACGMPWCETCVSLARVVRQLLRDLAERTWRPISTSPKTWHERLPGEG